MRGFDNSYMVLRKAIGILGIAFPVILFFSSLFLNSYIPYQGSISCYYHTPMHNIFEGIIWLFAIILVFYQYKGKDDVITSIAGLWPWAWLFALPMFRDATLVHLHQN